MATTNEERSMLLGEPAKRRRGRRRLLIGVLTTLVVLVAAVALLALPIVGSIVSGSRAVTIAGQDATLEVRGVSLSWFGPQRVRTVRVVDARGDTLADLRVEATTGLLSALRSGDLGVVTLSGEVDLPEGVVPTGGTRAPAPEVNPPVTPQAVPVRADLPRIPSWLRMEVRADGVRVSFPAPDGTRQTIEGLKASLAYDRAQRLDFSLTTVSPSVDLKIEARNLADADGRVTPELIEADIRASASAPAALIGSVTGSPFEKNDPAFTVEAALAVSGGRARLADPARPVRLTGALSRGLVERTAGERFVVDGPTRAAIVIDRLAVPIDAGGDWRTADLSAALTIEQRSGRIVLAEGEPARPMIVNASVVRAVINPASPGVLTVKGDGSVSIDGRPSGTLSLEGSAALALDERGGLRDALPARLRGELALDGVPAALGEGLVERFGVPLEEVLGPTVDLTLKASTVEEAQTDRPTGSIPPTSITAALRSDYADVSASVVVDERTVTGVGDGVGFEFRRIAPALRAAMRERGVVVEGDGVVRGRLAGLGVPLEGGMPALDRITGDLTVSLAGLTLEPTNESMPGLTLTDLQTGLALDGERPARATIDWNLEADGRPARVHGGATIDGLWGRDRGGAVRLAAETARVQGRIGLEGIPTAIAGLVPPEWIEPVESSLGETLNGSVEFASSAPDAQSVVIDLRSDGLRVEGAVERRGRRIETASDGVRATLLQPGALLAAASRTEGNTGVSVESTGPVTVTLGALRVDLPEDGAPLDLSALRGMRAEVSAAPMALSVRSASGMERIGVERSVLGLSVDERREAVVTVSSSGRVGSEAFTASGDMRLGALPDRFDAIAGSLTPEGRIEATGLPTALAALFVPEWGEVVDELTGGTASLALVAPAEGADRQSRSAALRVSSANLTLTARAEAATTDLRLGPVELDATITPSAAAAGLRAAGVESSEAPALESPSRVKVLVQQARMRLDGSGAPVAGSMGTLRAMVTLPDDLVIANLPGLEEGRRARFGARGVRAGLVYDRSDMLRSELSLNGTVFDPDAPRAEAGAVSLLSAFPAGRQLPRFTLESAVTDAALLDRLVGAGGLLADALGASALVTARNEFVQAERENSVTVSVASPRLKLDARAGVSEGMLRLREPATGVWQMSPSVLNRVVAAREGEEGGGRVRARFVEDVNAAILVSTLDLPMAGEERPFDVGAFRLLARATAPRVVLRSGTGGEPVVVSNALLEASTTETPGDLALTLRLNEPEEGARGRAAEPERFRADLAVHGLIASDGTVNAAGALVSGRAAGALPMALPDAMTSSDGLLVDLLGDIARVDVVADNLSARGGSLTARAVTDHSEASIKGNSREGTFVASEPVSVSLSRISPDLSSRVFESVLPLLAKVEKTGDDRPARVVAEGFTTPLDGNLHNLNGVFRIDLGTVQFETSTFFGRLLKMTNNRASGRLGQSVKPFDVVIERGVARYERVEIPLGEFNVIATGKVDLPNRELDLVTYVPFFAVADEVAAAFSRVPILDRSIMVPIRVRGPFDRPRTDVDPTLLLNESLPGNIIRGVEDLLRGTGGRRNNDKNNNNEGK